MWVAWLRSRKQDVGNLVHGLHVGNAICVNLGEGHDTLQHMIKGSRKQVFGLARHTSASDVCNQDMQGWLAEACRPKVGWLRHKAQAHG